MSSIIEDKVPKMKRSTGHGPMQAQLGTLLDIAPLP